MLRTLSRLLVGLVVVISLAVPLAPCAVLAQIDPQVRDRVVPAIVEIAILVDVTESGATQSKFFPIGSGTIISPDGLILTNWHVVDMAAHRAQLDAWEAQASRDGESLAFALQEDHVLILSTDGASVPQPMYTAQVVAEQHALDLAVLRITGDEYGSTVSDTPSLPFVPLGDSSGVRQGDPIDLFGYPMIGGDTLTYTDGVVSGFEFEEGIDGPAWITTNATMSGGSSGGAALDRAGRLIGIPTQGTELDCRPGDTNLDGTVDAADVGCIPIGGSIGQLRPIALALPLLADAGLVDGTIETETPAVAAVPTPVLPAASIDTAPTDPSGATSYVFAEDYCRNGPVYPPGTRIVLPREVIPSYAPDVLVRENGMALSYAFPYLGIPAGTEVEITGPYVENGVCDLWPVRYQIDGVEDEAYIDEWDLAPDFPRQVAPLPPERQSISEEQEEFCRSNPNYATFEAMVLSHESPLYSYRRGYGFSFQQLVAAGAEIAIAGPPIETGVCDMWWVEASLPNPDYVPPADRTDLEPGPLTEADYDESSEQIFYHGYMFEPDLRQEGS